MAFGGDVHDFSQRPADDFPGRASLIRQLWESLTVLAIAVLSFRLFMAEGYMISTGSMAPCLLGYHRQIECPVCHIEFASGVASSETDSLTNDVRAQDLYGDDLALASRCTCPNCGYEGIDPVSLPRNEGDQLMVHKHAYQFRDPRRWEVVVFHHPADPHQAYVKRVVGLPGETVDIVDGDLVVGGQVQAKPLSVQQGMRILVDDHSHQPDEESAPGWQSRWVTRSNAKNWKSLGDHWLFEHRSRRPVSRKSPSHDEFEWLEFRRWIPEGGRHVSTVPLEHWPVALGSPPATGQLLSYDPIARSMSCVGVLTDAERDQWTQRTKDHDFQSAICKLAELSHEAPIVDEYGYNPHSASPESFIVRDLMVEFDVDAGDQYGRFAIQLDDGRHRYRTVFDLLEETVCLYRDEESEPHKKATLPPESRSGPLHIEMSLMDRQALVAVNNAPVLPAVTYPEDDREQPAPRRPIQIGASEGQLRIRSLRVYRDVYYTPRSGADEPTLLGSDEFFVLGDNSPVSIDSRRWDDPAVHRNDLVGRPFVVHLPSRQVNLSLFGQQHHVRIPDFSRVRYIH